MRPPARQPSRNAANWKAVTNNDPPYTDIFEVPLGFEPLAEFLRLEEALALYREEKKKGVNVLIVQEKSNLWSLWAPRNPRWT